MKKLYDMTTGEYIESLVNLMRKEVSALIYDLEDKLNGSEADFYYQCGRIVELTDKINFLVVDLETYKQEEAELF